jgi:hypothetical protein
VGVRAFQEVSPFGAARRRARATTERAYATLPVARATGRSPGRAGRLLGNSAVSVSTAPAIVVRVTTCCSWNRGRWVAGWSAPALSPKRVLWGSASVSLAQEDRSDRRHRQCSPRRVCPLRTSCHFAGSLRHLIRGPSSVPKHVARLSGKRVGIFLRGEGRGVRGQRSGI